jgi:hypothetical protein
MRGNQMNYADKLTPKLVNEYHFNLLTHIDAELLTIENVDHALDLIPSAKKFSDAGGIVGKLFELLERFEIAHPMEFIATTAITLPLGFVKRTFIYVPWVPGDISYFSLQAQVEVLSHEAAHACRITAEWLGKYLTSFAFRTREERKAFQTSLELHFLLHGTVPSPDKFADVLTRYFLRPTDLDVLIAGLKAIMQPIREGDRSTPVGQWAAKWFKEKI